MSSTANRCQRCGVFRWDHNADHGSAPGACVAGRTTQRKILGGHIGSYAAVYPLSRDDAIPAGRPRARSTDAVSPHSRHIEEAAKTVADLLTERLDFDPYGERVGRSMSVIRDHEYAQFAPGELFKDLFAEAAGGRCGLAKVADCRWALESGIRHIACNVVIISLLRFPLFFFCVGVPPGSRPGSEY